jgi:hypothetical protein
MPTGAKFMGNKSRYLFACLKYASAGSVSRANTLSTLVGAALLYVLNMITGWKIPLPDGVPGLFVGGFYCFVVMWIVILMVRFVGAALHFALEPHTRPLVVLKQKLGRQMGPILLMASGFFLFVILSGSGLIWLVVQSARGTPLVLADNAPKIAATPPAPQISESDRAQLDLLARTKALSQKDKDDLSLVLRTISQIFNDADAIRSDATALVQDFYEQRGRSGVIAKNLNTTLLKLQAMTEAAVLAQKKIAPYSQGQYFDRQVNFIFAGTPNELQQLSNETESLSQFMQKWATIQNKNDFDIEALLEPSLKKFSTGFDKVYGWMASCRVRLGQIKEQIL